MDQQIGVQEIDKVDLNVAKASETLPFGYKKCFVVGVGDQMEKVKTPLNITPTSGNKDVPLSLTNFPSDKGLLLRVVERGVHEKFFQKTEIGVGENEIGFEEVRPNDIPKDAKKIDAVDAVECAAKYKEVEYWLVDEIKEERAMRSAVGLWEKAKIMNGEGVYKKPIRWVVHGDIREVLKKEGKDLQDVYEWDKGKRGLDMPKLNTQELANVTIEVQTEPGKKEYFKPEARYEEGKNTDLGYLTRVSSGEAKTGTIVGVDEINKVYDMFGQVTEKTIKWYRKWNNTL